MLEGGRLDRGMPSFAGFLDAAQLADVRQYLLSRRNALAAEQAKAAREPDRGSGAKDGRPRGAMQ